MFERPPQIRQPFTRFATSIAAHCGLILLLIHQVSSKPVRAVALPGTALGSHVEITYLPGRAPSQTLSKQSKPKATNSRLAPIQPKQVEAIAPSAATLSPPPPRPHFASSQPSPSLNSLQVSAVPDATTGSDSLGSGSIQIALTTYSPSPRPDLSLLPRGVQGDVVLDVTIDTSGKVAEVAVVHTLGYGIDEAVISTVRTWVFRPATRDGVPVSSAQDVLFHYGPV